MDNVQSNVLIAVAEIAEPHASIILAASAEIRVTIEDLILAAM